MDKQKIALQKVEQQEINAQKEANRYTKAMGIQGMCMALCFFAFQLTEFTVNDRASVLLGAEWVNLIYSLGIACTGLGFLSFSVLRKTYIEPKNRKGLLLLVSILSILFSMIMLVTESQLQFIVSSLMALWAYGHIGGNVYYNVAMSLNGCAYKGRTLGIGMGSAVFLQFFVQNLLVTDITFILAVIMSVLFLDVLSLTSSENWVFGECEKDDLPKELMQEDASCKKAKKGAEVLSAEKGANEGEAIGMPTKKKGNPRLLLLCIVTLLMSLVVGLVDGVVVAKHAEGSLCASAYARLFYGFSLLAAGFVADFKERKYIALVTVCTLFVSTISTAFISGEETFFWATAFLYMYSGFYVLYFTISFLDIAPRESNPALWAGMGRVLRSLTAAVTAIPVSLLYEKWGSGVLVVGSCLLSVITLLVLGREIVQSLFGSELENSVVAQEGKEQEAGQKLPLEASRKETGLEVLKRYADERSLTPREAEVLEKLLTTEDGVQEIADSMYVSRRALQRYIASIYEKTGTKSRIGLFQNVANYEKGLSQ